jgi:hypothetical protein
MAMPVRIWGKDYLTQEEISLESLSFGLSPEISPGQDVVSQEDTEEVVLDLEAEPVNFLHLELQPHDLNAEELSGFESGNGTDVVSAQQSSREAFQASGVVAPVPAIPAMQESSASQQAGSSSQAAALVVPSQTWALNVGYGFILDDSSDSAQVVPSESNLQVGRIFLPDSLEIDPGLLALQDEGLVFQNRLPNAGGVRLWARHCPH